MTFVLVHGAFRGGWAWREVRARLVMAGHDVHAPSLVGAGELSSRVGDVTGLGVWTDQVVDLIELEDLRDVVLVGHSQGGLVTTSVANRIPERIATLVHLDAAVPAPGDRAIDLGPSMPEPPPRDAVVPPRPVEPGGEYDDALAAWVNARLCPSPVGPALDPVPAVPDRVDEVFAFCAGTPDGYPSTYTRARIQAAGRDFTELDAGHDAPLTAPALVADLLLSHVTPLSPSMEGSR